MLASIIARFRTNSLLVTILLSYTIIGILLILVFSFSVFNSYYNSTIAEINDLSKKMLNQSYKVAETFWEPTFSDLYELFYQDNEFTDFIYSDTYGTDLIIGVYNRMVREMSSRSHMLFSIYLYNPRMDLIASNFTTAMKEEEFYDQDIVRLIDSGKIDREIYAVPRRADYRLMTAEVRRNLITIIFSHRNAQNQVTAAMIFNLDQQSLEDLVSDNGTDSSIHLLIINSQGGVISAPDDTNFATDISDRPYIQEILGSRENRGEFTTRLGTGDVLVTYLKSNKVLDWVFIGLGDYEKMKDKIYAYKRTILLFTSIFLIIDILIAALFTRLIYNPIYHLLLKMRSQEKQKGSQAGKGELEYLGSTYDRLVSNVRDLETSLHDSMPARRNELLRKIMNGELVHSPGEISELNLDSPHYVVCILRIDSFRRMTERSPMKEIAMVRLALADIAVKSFEGHFPINVVDVEADSIAVIVHLREDSSVLEKTMTGILHQLQERARELMELTVTAAVGNAVDGIEEIRTSYRSALYAANHRLKFGKNAVLYYAGVSRLDTRPYQYPSGAEARLIACVNNDDKGGIERAVDQVTVDISEFSCDEILLAIYQLLLSTASHFRRDVHLNRGGVLLDFVAIHEKLSYCDDMEDIRSMLRDIYVSIAEEKSRSRPDKSRETVEYLVKYIGEHFRDPNLSADLLSGVVGLSTNHIRRVFKEYTNKSIYNYISELRFEAAKRMLGETDLPAYQISEVLGFQSSAYFYVAFRKYEGRSPDEYRRGLAIRKDSD